MGGPGSGMWYRGKKKHTVEDCLFIDINEIVRNGLKSSDFINVFKKTSSGLRKKPVGHTFYLLNVEDRESPVFYIPYRLKEKFHEHSQWVAIPLQKTFLCSGGHRWWFTCPITDCGRRVGVLYLPPGGDFFGCRHCHDLTYRSSQESHSAFYKMIAAKIPGATEKDVRRVLDRVWI